MLWCNGMSRVLYSFTSRVYGLFEKKPYVEKTIYIALIAAMIVLGMYLRVLPALKYGLELHANDPWIEYWQVNYTYHHGLLSWYSLTQGNPDTHLFWYPWGRDFPLTSYPGLPLWATATYHVVKLFGLSIKDWVVLQPIIFAFFSFLTLYLAVKEVSRGNRYAIIAAIVLYAILPAASDRNIVGFVEKEGIAITFIYLYIYFYSKLAKLINKNVDRDRKIMYTILAALSMALVGWFWGGFIYVLGTVIVFLVLYPLFAPKEITWEFIKYHLLLLVLTMLFVLPSPNILKSLGFYPFRIKSLGLIMLSAMVLPIIFNLLYKNYKRIGFRKPLLNPPRYLGVLIIILVAGLILYTQGFISISARYAWALGLRALTPAPPLTQSIEEHQSPLSSPSNLYHMLLSWGTGLMPLMLFSPLMMAVFGAFYLLYKGEMDRIYLAVAFIVAFYSYLNAAYMEATASSTGLVVASIFIGFIASKIFPTREEVAMWRRGRIGRGVGGSTRLIALIIIILLSVNLVFSGLYLYRTHSNMIYSIMSAGAPLGARCDAWYEALEFMRKNLSKYAVVVAWWDYGYWISVGGGKHSVADGATLNNTQIKILARILTASSSEEAIHYMKMLHLPPNDTYILVFDAFWFVRDTNDPNKYTVYPYISQQGGLVGLIDIPKSIWMIRIGENKSIGDVFYLYNIIGGTPQIAPRFDQPENLPLIYRIMVDGILYLNAVEENKTYQFIWFTGEQSTLSYDYRFLEKTLGLKYEVTVTKNPVSGQPKTVSLGYDDRPFKNDPYIQPYKIIVEPFEGVKSSGNAVLVEVIFIYKVTIPP